MVNRRSVALGFECVLAHSPRKVWPGSLGGGFARCTSRGETPQAAATRTQRTARNRCYAITKRQSVSHAHFNGPSLMYTHTHRKRKKVLGEIQKWRKKKSDTHPHINCYTYTHVHVQPSVSQLTTGERKEGRGRRGCTNTHSPVLRFCHRRKTLGEEEGGRGGTEDCWSFSSCKAAHAGRPCRPQ